MNEKEEEIKQLKQAISEKEKEEINMKNKLLKDNEKNNKKKEDEINQLKRIISEKKEEINEYINENNNLKQKEKEYLTKIKENEK